MQDCLKGNVQVKFPIFPEIIGWWLANDCLTFVYNNDAKKTLSQKLVPSLPRVSELGNWDSSGDEGGTFQPKKKIVQGRRMDILWNPDTTTHFAAVR